MQFPDELLAQEIAATAAQCPCLCARDVLLLGLIQLIAVGNMRRNEVAHFFGRKRCRGIVGLFEKISQGLVPEQPGIGFAHDPVDLPFDVLRHHLLILQGH